MKISLEWLKDYLPGELEAQAAADALTHAGLPVETIEQIGPDTVIDVEVTSNRSDCLSYLGVARELAALLGREFRDVRSGAPQAAAPASEAVSVEISDPDLCPHYTARVIRNVTVGPSSAWMVRRLEAMGLRPINNVVDVTNYVLFETGQPLHAFDFDKIAGRRIVIRRARPGEKLVSIDGHERKLKSDMLAIADTERPVALAGVMGGMESEVTGSTTNVLLESARFDPLSVRKTSRALAMKSDSSYRFERGIDPTLPERASLRAAQLILETAGGELLGGSVAAGSPGYEPKSLRLRLARLKQILGIDVPADQALDALRRLGLSPSLQADAIEVAVPSWRLDLTQEIDLVEEVARLVGYDQIPVRDEISIRLTPPEPQRQTMDLIRSTLVGGGYFESITFTFVSDALAGDFTPAEAGGLPRADPSVRKADAHLRPSILPGLLESVRRNESAGTLGARLFEIGSTFWLDRDARLVERPRVALVGSADPHDVRGVVELLLKKLDRTKPLRIVPDDRAGYAAGVSARIEWGGQTVGHLGRISTQVADKLSLREAPAAAELDLEPLLAGAQHVPQLQPLPRYPAVQRDLSLVVSDSVRFDQIKSLIRELKPEMLESVHHVTTYRGKPLERGTKSVTISLSFRSPAATLTADQVEPGVQRIVEAARQRLSATLRT